MWIELKATSPTETTRVRPEQVAWAKRRVKQRGRVVIVDRHEEAWYLWEYTIGIEFTKIGKYMTPTTLPHQKFRHAVELAAYLKGTLIS